MNSEEHHNTAKVAAGDNAKTADEVLLANLKVFEKHHLSDYFEVTQLKDGGFRLKMLPEVEELDTKILAAVKSLEGVISEKIVIRDLTYKAKYEAASVIKATEKLEDLRALQADFSNQYSWVEQFFKSLSELQKLEELTLKCSFSPLNELPESITTYPLNFPNLKTLRIVLSHTSLAKLDYLTQCLKNCTGVKHLKLSLAGNGEITIEEMQNLNAVLSTFKSLEFVHLNLNNMASLTPPVMVKLREWIGEASNLQTLKLGLAESKSIEQSHVLALIESIKKNPSIKKVVLNIKDCSWLTKPQLTAIQQEVNALGIDAKVKCDLKKKSSMCSCQ